MIKRDGATERSHRRRRSRRMMRTLRCIDFLFLMMIVSVLLLLPTYSAPYKKQKKTTLNPNDNDIDNADIIDGILIEDNPDYKEEHVSLGDDEDSDGSDEDGDDDDDDSDSENDDDDDESKALKSKKKGKLAPFKKHRASITLAVALFAFRKEILALILNMLHNSGKYIDATSFLKFVLFVDTLRKLQTGGAGIFSSENGERGLFSTLTSIMSPNPASLPPISQHYTFER